MPRSSAPCSTPGSRITSRRRSGSGGDAPRINTNDASAIHALPEPLQSKVIEAFASSLHDVFLAALPIVAIAFLISLFIKEIPLRTRDTPVADPSPVE